jgi:hypothetical protein
MILLIFLENAEFFVGACGWPMLRQRLSIHFGTRHTKVMDERVSIKIWISTFLKLLVEFYRPAAHT